MFGYPGGVVLPFLIPFLSIRLYGISWSAMSRELPMQRMVMPELPAK